MSNPFHVRWLNGWSFQTVLMEGQFKWKHVASESVCGLRCELARARRQPLIAWFWQRTGAAVPCMPPGSGESDSRRIVQMA